MYYHKRTYEISICKCTFPHTTTTTIHINRLPQASIYYGKYTYQSTCISIRMQSQVPINNYRFWYNWRHIILYINSKEKFSMWRLWDWLWMCGLFCSSHPWDAWNCKSSIPLTWPWPVDRPHTIYLAPDQGAAGPYVVGSTPLHLCTDRTIVFNFVTILTV